MKRLALLLLALPCYAQVTVSPIVQPHISLVDGSGNPCSGCKLYSYSAGTTTQIPTYKDAVGVSQNTNPIVLSASGGADVWLGGNAYKFVLKNSLGTTLWTADQVQSMTALINSAVIKSPTGSQIVTQPVDTSFDVITSGTGEFQHNGNPIVDTVPAGNQTIVQPSNTNFTVTTSGTGALVSNGNVLLNFNQVQNAFNYFNYLYSSSDFQAPTAVTNRTWANPEHYIAVTDNSPYATNPNPQADLTATPILHIESFNNSPNDAAPIYVHQRCTNTVEGNPPNNNGCVGIIAAVDNTAGSKSFLEAGNFIMQIFSTDPLIQAQGFELNAFNWSGSDSLMQATNAFTRGPYLGINATAGGNNKMVAGFHTTDQGHGSGWQYGAWVEQAVDANFMAGLPGGGNGSQDALRASTVNSASSGSNSASMPIDFRSSFWNGTISSPFATVVKAMPLDNSTNPVQCLNVAFTTPGSTFNLCNDGSIQSRGTSWKTFNGAPTGNCSPGDFGTNASPADKNSVLYVCFPANTWNAMQAVP